jgi:hypothetical protein
VNSEKIDHFISLLQKWKNDDLNWGECCELREFGYQYSDAIDEYWKAWVSE